MSQEQNRREDSNRLQDLQEKLSDELARRYEVSQSIRREGTQIVLPHFMSLREASTVLRDHYMSSEEKTSKEIIIEGHVNDCLYAFYSGVRSVFGNLTGVALKEKTFFGGTRTIESAASHSVVLDYDKVESLPIGHVSIPGLPVQIHVGISQRTKERRERYNKTVFDDRIVITCEYLKKHEPLVEMIEQAARDHLKERSIFRGKAINSQFDFINLTGFDLSRVSYGEKEERELTTHLFTTIQDKEGLQALGINIKRTVLLYGRFGTGKTLTALLCAVLARKHGWTFINVLPGDDVSTALQFAQKYQPCVVFFEDVDSAVASEKERSADVNEVLNIIDGLLSKQSQVICILTTNHIDRIERAMLRPGRIDRIIEMGVLDLGSFSALVRLHCGPELVTEDLDYEALFAEARGYTPAFVVEACVSAQLYAYSRGSDQITEQDLIDALRGQRAQYECMTAFTLQSEPEVTRALRKLFEDVIGSLVEEMQDGQHTLLDEIEGYTGRIYNAVEHNEEHLHDIESMLDK